MLVVRSQILLFERSTRNSARMGDTRFRCSNCAVRCSRPALQLHSSLLYHFCGFGDDCAVDRVARQSIVPRSNQPVMATPNSPKIYDGPYAAQLIETANAMVAPGKGPRPGYRRDVQHLSPEPGPEAF